MCLYCSGGFFVAAIMSYFAQDGSIEFEEFIRALSVTSRGNLDEKLHCKYTLGLVCLFIYLFGLL